MSDAAGLDQLMKELSEGNRAVFAQVFQLLWAPTRRLCTRLMGGDSDGDDAAQTSMLRIFERANEYDARRPALPWAMGIASWECRTLLKRRARLREAGDVPTRDSDDGAAVQEHEQRELIGAAKEALGTLSDADQETLISTYWETASGVSGATLRKRRERALTRLRDAFRRLYGLD